LIGVPPPLNSVGVLPTAFLSGDDHFKIRNLLTNAKQILSQFLRKSQLKEVDTLWFKPYDPLRDSAFLVQSIERHIENKNYQVLNVLFCLYNFY
jgi:phosphatidylinositol glycan class N